MNNDLLGVLVFTTLTLLAGFCTSEITVAIKFISFKNPRSRDVRGDRCDPRLFGSTPCDYFFEICVDRIRKSQPHTDHWIANCDIKLERTGAYHDMVNINNFGRDMRGLSNPILIHLKDDQRSDGIALRVRVMDYDNGHRGDPDTVDHLNFDYVIESHKVTQFGERRLMEPHTAVLNGRRTNEATSMTIEFQTYCTEHYFKDVHGHCSIFCKESRDYHKGYYTCTEKGEKVCIQGWLDPTSHCKTAKKNCFTDQCYNGGQCIGGASRFECNCTSGFTGEDCSICKTGATCQQILIDAAPQSGGGPGGSNNGLIIGLVIGILLLIVIIILIIALLLRERRKRRMKEQGTGTATISTTTMGQQTAHIMTTDTATGGPIYNNAFDSSFAQTENARNAARATQAGGSGAGLSNEHVPTSSGAKALEAGLLASPPPYKATDDRRESDGFKNPTYDNATNRSAGGRDNIYDVPVSVAELNRKY